VILLKKNVNQTSVNFLVSLNSLKLDGTRQTPSSFFYLMGSNF
jgi:hypothetical protein